MEILAHFEILDPPSKYIIQKKTKKDQTIYLTNNLFYGGVYHWAVQRKCINYAKDSIIHYFNHIPKMSRCNIELIYHSPKNTFDLDNKAGFWVKMILDIMKTPSEKERLKAAQYNNTIRSISVLPDDSAKFVKEISMKYKKGSHRLEIIIHGIRQDEQQSIFEKKLL